MVELGVGGAAVIDAVALDPDPVGDVGGGDLDADRGAALGDVVVGQDGVVGLDLGRGGGVGVGRVEAQVVDVWRLAVFISSSNAVIVAVSPG